jgi:hypothetical protein
MSPLGIQRTVALLLLISPWIYIPSIYKEIIFIIAGVFLYISTVDIRKKPKVHDEGSDAASLESSPTTPVYTPSA